MERETFNISDLVKVGEAFAWSERPAIGAEVALNSGSMKMTISAFVRDQAICHSEDGQTFLITWCCLRPWSIQ